MWSAWDVHVINRCEMHFNNHTRLSEILGAGGSYKIIYSTLVTVVRDRRMMK